MKVVLEFRDKFMMMTGQYGNGPVDPFEGCITIAGAANNTFHKLFLKPNTIELISNRGVLPNNHYTSSGHKLTGQIFGYLHNWCNPCCTHTQKKTNKKKQTKKPLCMIPVQICNGLNTTPPALSKKADGIMYLQITHTHRTTLFHLIMHCTTTTTLLMNPVTQRMDNPELLILNTAVISTGAKSGSYVILFTNLFSINCNT